MSRGIAAVAVALLLLFGCGSDGGDSETDAGAAAQTVDAGDAGDTDESQPVEEESDGGSDGEVSDLIDDLDFGDGTAVVTIGDTVYEFTLGGNETADGRTFIGACQELFGLIVGGGFVPGDPETTIDFQIPPPDWESFDDGRYESSEPRIEIEFGDEGGLAADLTLAANRPEMAGLSQIDEWTLDNGVAVGTATFIEMEPFSAPVEGAAPVEGSFQIGCAQE